MTAAEQFRKATRLWQILALAMADLRKAERRKTVRVDMSSWYVYRDGVCEVCMAGAVMLCRFKDRGPENYKDPGDFSFRIANKFDAIDCLRRGSVSGATFWIKAKYRHYDLDRKVATYGHPDFWPHMKTLLADLKKANI